MRTHVLPARPVSTPNPALRPTTPSLRRVATRNVTALCQQRRQDAACATAVSDDRERIAQDLYDAVIHRLFAAGLQLRATCQVVEEPELVRIETTIDLLDITITELRKAIFSLR